jgi:heme a synthase
MKLNKNHFILSLLIFLTFDLMLLGAGVRTMNAGLTCPDWPLCFGKIIPKYHFGVYLEFIHRVIAGILGILYIYFFIKVFKNTKFKEIRLLSVIGLFLLFAQIIMGGLTVLKLLAAYIVTMHLGLATLFLLSLFWMKKTLDLSGSKLSPSQSFHFFNSLLILTILFIVLQILLGGMVASTYSGLVCIDFPTCNGQYFPPMVGPIAIQMTHRFGAYFLSLLVLSIVILGWKWSEKLSLNRSDKIKILQILVIIICQILVGILNLKYLMPAFLSVIHLGLALTLLLNVVSLRFAMLEKVNKKI